MHKHIEINQLRALFWFYSEGFKGDCEGEWIPLGPRPTSLAIFGNLCFCRGS
jgi:hypothetical protein